MEMEVNVLLWGIFLNKMKRANFLKTGAGLAALTLAGIACAPSQNIGVEQQKSKATVENLNGKSLNPANAKPFSELPVPTQIEYFFKIPSSSIRQNELGDLTGFRAADDYTVVYCSYIGNDMTNMESFNQFDAQDELARQLGVRKGILEDTRINGTRRIGKYFCGSYSVDRKIMKGRRK